MAFAAQGPAITLAVTSAGQTVVIPAMPQCRIWNAGPNSCRIAYVKPGGNALAGTKMPATLLETHHTLGNYILAAVCDPGEMAMLEIIAGQDD